MREYLPRCENLSGIDVDHKVVVRRYLPRCEDLSSIDGQRLQVQGLAVSTSCPAL
jgi:hypothetical protein